MACWRWYRCLLARCSPTPSVLIFCNHAHSILSSLLRLSFCQSYFCERYFGICDCGTSCGTAPRTLLRFHVWSCPSFLAPRASSRRPARSEAPGILVTKLSKLGGKTLNTCSTIIVSEGRSSTSPRLLMRTCTSVRKSPTLVPSCICRLEKLALMASSLALFFTSQQKTIQCDPIWCHVEILINELIDCIPARLRLLVHGLNTAHYYVTTTCEIYGYSGGGLYSSGRCRSTT